MIGIKLSVFDKRARRPFNLLSLSPAAVWDIGVRSSLFQDAAATTPVTAVGDPVGYVADLSGNGNHLTQGTSTKRPIYRASGGLFWLDFDQVDDFLTTANGALNLSALWVNIAFRSGAGSGVVWSLPQDPSSVVSPYYRYSLWCGLNVFTRHINGTQTNGGTLVANTNYVAEEFSGDGQLIVNNTTVLSSGGNALTYPNAVPFYVGSSPLNAGNVTGLEAFYGGIVCAAKPSASLRSAATTWLGAKAGLSL